MIELLSLGKYVNFYIILAITIKLKKHHLDAPKTYVKQKVKSIFLWWIKMLNETSNNHMWYVKICGQKSLMIINVFVFFYLTIKFYFIQFIHYLHILLQNSFIKIIHSIIKTDFIFILWTFKFIIDILLLDIFINSVSKNHILHFVLKIYATYILKSLLTKNRFSNIISATIIHRLNLNSFIWLYLRNVENNTFFNKNKEGKIILFR